MLGEKTKVKGKAANVNKDSFTGRKGGRLAAMRRRYCKPGATLAAIGLGVLLLGMLGLGKKRKREED